MLLRIALFFLGLLLFLALCLLVYAFGVPRPLDTTDPSIFLEDGKTVNYCDLPKLDGSGKSADDIPKAYTPGCGLKRTPMPILADCTEPLAEGVVDMRGLWQGVGHLERIEQCGNRARDIGAFCNNFNTAIHFDDGVMVFRLFNLFDTVTRRMNDEEMIFTFINGVETRTKRICKYPKV